MLIKDEIEEQYKIAKINAMKNPVILVNEDDFEILKTELGSNNIAFSCLKNILYKAVPIRVCRIIKKGNFMVYDDDFFKFINV